VNERNCAGFSSWLWRTRAGNRVLSLPPLALALTAAAVIRVCRCASDGNSGGLPVSAAHWMALSWLRRHPYGRSAAGWTDWGGALLQSLSVCPIPVDGGVSAVYAAANLPEGVEAACSEQQCGLVASGTFIRGGFFFLRNTAWYQQWFY